MDTESSRFGLLEIILGGLGVVALGVSVTQEKGSEGSGSAATVNDGHPPRATLKIFAGSSQDSATIRSSENGTVYLVHTSVAVSTPADITGAADALWNKVEVTANTDTALSFAGLLHVGRYKLYFVDAAGNLSPAAVDTGPVDANLVPPSLALASDTGSSNSDNYTNNGMVNVSGLESGATWEYQVDGGNWITGSGGSFMATAGGHGYFVRQTNKAANTFGFSSFITCDLDTTAPPAPSLWLSIDTGSSNSDGITRIATIIVSGQEMDNAWDYQVDGGNWIPGGSWIPGGNSFTASTGSHTYAIRQTDLAGNASISPTVTYTLDRSVALPSLALADDTGSSNSDGITTNGTVNVSGLESGATWEYRVDANRWTAGSGSSFMALAGNHTYIARQKDMAGNTSSRPPSVTYTLDTTTSAVVGDDITSETPSGLGTMNIDVTTGNFNDLAGNANAADTITTQSSGAVKGVDDARTVIAGVAGEYTLVLPPLAELTARYNAPSLPGHPPPACGNAYCSTPQTSADSHAIFNLAYGTTASFGDINIAYVALQVL